MYAGVQVCRKDEDKVGGNVLFRGVVRRKLRFGCRFKRRATKSWMADWETAKITKAYFEVFFYANYAVEWVTFG